jgi:cytochrome c556
MTYRRIGILAGVGLVTLGLVAGYATTLRGQGPAPPTDTRQRLALPPAGRDKVLAEMRHMLESVNGIVKGVAGGDLAAVETAARASGMAVAADVDPQVMQALPPFFRQLGMRTHQGFDHLADRMKAGGTRDDALRALAALTENCVTCHSTYRLDEAR